jgi:hypothetical protein
MHELNAMQTCGNIQSHHSFAETFSLKAGLKKFGTKARQAAAGEMKQLHNRAVFKPIDVNELSPEEKKKTLRSLIFLTENETGQLRRARAPTDPSNVHGWNVKKPQAVLLK